jgi:NADH-quinone oxidoreductase subunit N
MLAWSANRPNENIIWETPIMLLIGLFFMLSLISANNLLVLFFGIEGLSITLYYVLAGDIKKGNTQASMLGYFVLGASATLMSAFGILRIYLETGTFYYSELKHFFDNLNNFEILEKSFDYKITLTCLLLGLLFKLAAFPNYFWIRNLYCVASTPIVAYFAVPVKLTLFITVFKLFTYAFAGLSSI